MSTLIVKNTNQVLDVRLNRPAKRNALNTTMVQELTDTFNHASQQKGVRVVLLSGEGKNFCAGADLNEMRQTKNYSFEQNLAQARQLYKMFESVYNCPLPVVCQAHGFNAGGALGLMAACDVVVLDAAAKFCFSEVRLGLVAAVISPFVRVKMQSSAAQAWITSGITFTAKQAYHSHLAHFVGRELEVNQFIKTTLEAYLQADSTAVSEVKKLHRHYYKHWFSEEQQEKLVHLIARLRTSDVAQQRMGRFLERKKVEPKK